MSTDLAVIQRHETSLTQFRPPEAVLAEAKKAAEALVKVVDMKKNKVVFNNETYLEFEDWQTVGKFYGCTTKILSTSYVEFGDVHGFEATAVVLDHNQCEIGRVESMCLSDEENWGMVPKYEWQDILDDKGKKIWDANLRNGKGGYKAKKVKVGESPKPLFQLRSMAQTRASAKALKSIFSWVVVLAGYRPQVAEEMTGQEFDEEHDQTRSPVSMPKSTDDKKLAAPRETKEADTKPTPSTKTPTTTASTVGTNAAATSAPAELEELSGEIVSVTPGKNGVLVLNVKGYVVVVPGRLASDDLIVGAKVLMSVAKVTIKGQHMFEAREIKMAVPPPADDNTIDGEVIEPGPRTDKLDALFDDVPMAPKEQTTMEPAPPATEAAKPGTIGLKRAKRLYTLISQNCKNTGFTEVECKKIMQALPVPIEHVRDIELGLYPEFEKWATGEADFQDFWKE